MNNMNNMNKQQMEQQEIIQTFQQMRNEQRSLMSKITELEQDLNEHKVVIDTLEDVSPDRKCFRMIGGVLVERTVVEILPALQHNKTQLTKLLEGLNTKLQSKGKELNEYKEKHGIQIKGQGEAVKSLSQSQTEPSKESSTSGVLVSNKS